MKRKNRNKDLGILPAALLALFGIAILASMPEHDLNAVKVKANAKEDERRQRIRARRTDRLLDALKLAMDNGTAADVERIKCALDKLNNRTP